MLITRHSSVHTVSQAIVYGQSKGRRIPVQTGLAVEMLSPAELLVWYRNA